ncbi:hypothetical protein C8J57DRAFT_1666005, partial [Mycena rebaudengoi]
MFTCLVALLATAAFVAKAIVLEERQACPAPSCVFQGTECLPNSSTVCFAPDDGTAGAAVWQCSGGSFHQIIRCELRLVRDRNAEVQYLGHQSVGSTCFGAVHEKFNR